MRRHATAGGDRRRRAGRGVRRRVPAARARRRRDRPVRAAAHAVGAAARRRGARPPGDQAPRGHVRPQTLGRGCRFLGNVEVGVDVSHAELMRHYTAVDLRHRRADRQVARDPRRGPARQLGRHRVRRLVQRPPGLPRPRVRPVRAARRGDRQRQRRGGRDAHAHAERARARAHGRRRPRARGAAREPRSRRWSCSAGAGPRRRRSRAPSCASWAASTASTCVSTPTTSSSIPCRAAGWPSEGTFTARKNVELLREFAARPRAADARRRIELRFLRSPVEIRGRRPGRGDRRPPQRDRARRRRLAAGAADRRGRGDDRVRPRAALGRLPGGAAARRAVRRAPLRAPQRARPGARARRRAASRACTPSAGSSAARPGSSGTNKRDAEETVSCLVEDLRAGALRCRRARAASGSTRCSPSASRTWSRRRAGARSTGTSSSADASEQRPRVKLASRHELLLAAAARHGRPAGRRQRRLN